MAATVAIGKESTCSHDQAFAQGNSAGLSLQAPCAFLCLFILSLGFSLSLSVLANRQMAETLPDMYGFSYQGSGLWVSS